MGLSNSEELISVVIPSAGRRNNELLKAVQSVNAQDVECAIEIIVADDSLQGLDATALRLAAGSREIRVVRTDRIRGLARRVGVEASRGGWIAFLDDDDIWDADKLRKQLVLAQSMRAEGHVPVISCRLRHSFADGRSLSGGIPRRLIADQHVAEYLFSRRPATVGRPSIFSSTLLVPAALCRAVPWRTVPRHQDWDWLVRAQKFPGVRFAHHPEDLVTIAVGSTDSISATSDWKSSVEWAASALRDSVHPRVYADFLIAQPMRYALQGRNWDGVVVILSELAKTRKLPSMPALATGAAGVLSRRRMEQIMALAGSINSFLTKRSRKT